MDSESSQLRLSSALFLLHTQFMSTPLKVAIIGAGPPAFYVASQLLSLLQKRFGSICTIGYGLHMG